MSFRDLTKRDFLKVAGLTAAAVVAQALDPRPALAKAVRKVAGDPDPSWARIRDSFPLSRERAYFNAGTLGPSPKAVTDAITKELLAVETTGEASDAWSATLRERLGKFVGASADEIALTHNTTDGVNIVAGGLKLSAGDEVIITTHEHVGNALPWLNRARLDGVVLKSFVPPRTALEVVRAIEALITPRTRVIAIPHISCTTGQVFPIAEIVAAAKPHGIFVFVDGAHGTGMLPLDLTASGIHFYASSTHKWLCGPKGVGYLYIRKSMLDQVEPKFVGAHSDTGWNLESRPPRIDGFAPSAHRFDYGSQSTALYAGAVAAITFFEKIGQAKITDHGFGLAQGLQAALATREERIEMLTPTEARSRAMVISFRFRDGAKSAVKFASFAQKHGFRVRQVPEAGLGAVRVSTHLYNTAAEVERFVATLDSYLSS